MPPLSAVLFINERERVSVASGCISVPELGLPCSVLCAVGVLCSLVGRVDFLVGVM